MYTLGSLLRAADGLLPAPTPTARLAQLEEELLQARAEAAQARQHLEALTHNLHEGLLLVSADLRVVLLNERVCELFDLPRPASQWLGQPIAELIALARNYMADPLAYDADVAQQATTPIDKHQLQLADGRMVERDTRAIMLGDAPGWLLSYRDVTAHYQAQNQREAQRIFYETLLDEVPVEIIVLDEQRRYLYVNPQSVPDPAQRAWLLGRTVDEYCARYGFPLGLATQRNRMFELAEVSTEPVFWDDRTPTANGAVYHQRQFKLLPEATPGHAYMLGCGLDVTARVLAEERSQRSETARREHQEFMQNVLDTSPNPIYVRDVAGQVVFGNKALQQLELQSTPLPADERLRRMKACEQAKQTAVNAQVLRTGQEVQAEESVTLPTGEQRWFYSVKRPLVRPDGTVQVLGVSTDITALKAAQLAAEEATQARESFLAIMSHEIRTPMSGVLGMAGLLAKTTLDSQQQEFVRSIRSSGTHLLGILNDVLDVSKIQAGKLALEQLAFHLHEAVQLAVAPLALQAQEKGLSFAIEPFQHTEAPWVLSDPFRLNQILLNLLSNAIKFTSSGGVRLRSQLVAQGASELHVRFEVHDSGMGIELEALGRIFEQFTQAHADTSRRYGGTGLGLSISQALVAQLGGRLDVASTPGVGSTFSFTLPLARANAPAPTPLLRADTGQLRGCRVLLAEDNPVNRTVARLHLQQWGMLVEEAEDGLTAHHLLEQHTYDIVLMDIQLPGMSGVEVSQHLRRHPDAQRATTPILALTANSFRRENEQYLAAGLDDYLTKPFAEEQLYAKLTALLHRAAPPAPTPPYSLNRLQQEARGHRGFVAGMIQSFLKHTPANLARLRAAGAAQDWASVAELVHHIKPNLLTLSITAALAPVHTLEEPPVQLPAPDAPLRQAAIAQLLAAVEATLAALPAELLTQQPLT
ncbi:MAG: response regulator [Janthinobacterium lividum]